VEERISVDQFNPNIEEVAEHVFLGPQADILERLENFNQRWETNLKLTKKFYWAPGSYIAAKKTYADQALMFKMKPSGMHSIFDRMSRYSYYANNYKRDLLVIEDMRKNLVFDKTIMTDNSDVIIESFRTVKDKMLTLHETDNYEVHVETFDEYRKYRWAITVILPPNVMNVLHSSGEDGIIGTVPIDGLGLRFNINMFRHLNWSLNPTVSPGFRNGYNSYDRNRIDIHGLYEGMNDQLRHPYIANLYMDNGQGPSILEDNYMLDGLRTSGGGYGSFSSVCFGDLSQAICESIYSQNWEELNISLNMWNSNYSYPHTGPLNNLREAFNGKPAGHSNEFWNIVGISDCRLNSLFLNQLTSTVNDKWSSTLSYCDDTECELRDTCRGYRKMHPVERSEEITAIFKDMIDMGIDHTKIQDNYTFLEDKDIKISYKLMKDCHDEWNGLLDNIVDEDHYYSFQECFEDEGLMDDLRALAKLDPVERKQATKSQEEAKVLESLLAQGLSGIPTSSRSNPLINDDGSEEEPHNFRNNTLDIEDYEATIQEHREIEEENSDEPFLNS
jgi:hypothetical protein